MTPQQQKAVDAIRAAVEDDELAQGGLGPVHVFEGTAGDDDVIVLYDADTRIISIDAEGVTSSGWVVPQPPAGTPGWDDGLGWDGGQVS